MTTQPLRSRNWFGRQDLDGFVHRSWLKTEGFSDVVFDGPPDIGTANSWSEPPPATRTGSRWRRR